MEEIDDSFDDVLATMELPNSQNSTNVPINEPKGDLPSTSKESVPINQLNEITEKPKYSNSVQVNPKQRGNPILKSITNIPWEYNDKIKPDYVVGKSACVLFLSLRYHNLKPDYIHERLKELGKDYELRVLLVHVDIKESQNALKHLTRICLLADLTLMLAWSPEEAGKIIETYKLFEKRGPDFIMEKSENDDYQKVINALTSIKSVNKTDAMTLLTNFGTLENLIQASENKLNSCPGLGVRKAQKISKVFNETFLK
ncbi:CLUMA_CG017777, isoform A [Clunio marinus]|uniref:DNA excision repair protein ERCC-1 n=1 Tax=Clunio marinus TaxID=568069 RepID=A0A1J1IWY4_9DIPT|nr:CLUMA_CG017777, isoform A [Clunio marinus]